MIKQKITPCLWVEKDAKAVAEYDEGVMIAQYRALYEQAAGRAGALS